MPAFFTVDTTADVVNAADGVTSLREAIIESNATDPGWLGVNTIGFSPMLVMAPGGVISLESELPTLAQDVWIAGPTAGAMTVQRDTTKGNFRLFEVAAGTEATFSNLTLAHGKTGSSGGAILSHGTLTINSCVLRDNEASRGGAVATTNQVVSGVVDKSYLTITNSVIRDNTAAMGGGLYLEDCDANISYTDIIYNSATLFHGGGIYANETAHLDVPVVTLSRVSVAGNTSAKKGGGIFCIGRLSLLDATLISYNVAQDADSEGGGVFMGQSVLEQSVLRFDNPTIGLNTATLGDGLYMESGVGRTVIGPTSQITFVDDAEYSEV